MKAVFIIFWISHYKIVHRQLVYWKYEDINAHHLHISTLCICRVGRVSVNKYITILNKYFCGPRNSNLSHLDRCPFAAVAGRIAAVH